MGRACKKGKVNMTEDRKKACAIFEKNQKALDALAEAVGDVDAWEFFTGLPESTLRDMMEWAVVGRVPFDELLMTVASIAYLHGKQKAVEYKATQGAKEASEPDADLEGRLATGADFPS
jgi:hypothetical protein